jgi:hypothetical protein
LVKAINFGLISNNSNGKSIPGKLLHQSDISSKKNSTLNDASKISVSLPKMSATVDNLAEANADLEPKI